MDAGRAWVAVDDLDRAVGYIVVNRVDGRAHIEQVSVRPSHARRGIGRMLVDHVARWAADEGMAATTLTKFADVPWNAPLYERIGFRRLRDEELSPGSRRVLAEEAARGLDRWPCVAMIRAVPSAAATGTVPPSGA
jgi:ribosomal protein S18 acetylase RimI-like enzyme